MTSKTLDGFAEAIRADLDTFVADYRNKNTADPETYPLTLAPAHYAGLFDKFVDYCLTRDEPQQKI